MFAVEQKRIFAGEQSWPASLANRVTNSVAYHGSDAEDQTEEPHVDESLGTQQSRRYEQRIARKEKTDKQPGLREYDHRHSGVSSRDYQTGYVAQPVDQIR